jgi:hypothetical protein
MLSFCADKINFGIHIVKKKEKKNMYVFILYCQLITTVFSVMLFNLITLSLYEMEGWSILINCQCKVNLY